MSNDSRHSVLVVEDNDEDFAMITHGLAEAGATDKIHRLSDVAAARVWLAGAENAACLILLDLNLPGGSGTDLVAAFKSDPRHRSTPLVVFSTSANEIDLRACYAAGANAYHVKPLETPFFHAMVKHIAQYWFDHALTLGTMK